MTSSILCIAAGRSSCGFWGGYFIARKIEVLQAFLPHIIKCEPELLDNKTFFVVTHEPSKIIVACGGWSPARVGTEEVAEGLGHLRQCLAGRCWERCCLGGGNSEEEMLEGACVLYGKLRLRLHFRPKSGKTKWLVITRQLDLGGGLKHFLFSSLSLGK